jgi:DNA-binding beta-propeller fold protein YncE
MAASPALPACGPARNPTEAPAGEGITAAIALECEAGAVAVGGASVWVVPHLDRLALRVDPTTNSVIDRIPLGDRGPGAEIAASDDMVWASVSSASYDFDRLVRIDPTTGSIVAWVEAAAAFPEIGAGSVWATGPGGIYRIDRATNTVAAVIEASNCWVITLEERAFCLGPNVSYSIDPITDAVTPVDGAPELGWPVIGLDGLIWAVDGESLRAFDPETGQIDADIKAPAATVWSQDGVVLDGSLWATTSSERGPADQLVRIDRQSMAIDCVLPTPTSELGMAAGFGSIWLPVLRQPWLLRIDPAC